MLVDITSPQVALSAVTTRIALACASTGQSAVIVGTLASQGCEIVPISFSAMSQESRLLLARLHVVLVELTFSTHDVLDELERLNAIIGISRARPRVLCYSTVHRNAEFVLKVQKCGARYVRIDSPEMLSEAVDLLLAEMRELERDGPHFEIIHRFSTGICGPGEEVSAVLQRDGDRYFQLPLGLAERLVFNLLAQRRLAVDSLQIVSGLGDWFYKEHAANSGHKQVKKIRRPTVKVLIQRIRCAMVRTFAKGNSSFDPEQVLRSCSAKGTNRVLYKLCAQISWRHPR